MENQRNEFEGDLPEGHVLRFYHVVDDKTVYALVEVPESRVSYVVYKDDSCPANEDFPIAVSTIYPLYEDLGFVNNFLVEANTGVRELVPEMERLSPVSYPRSNLGEFNWDHVPDEMAATSTYKDNYPLDYLPVISNIDTTSELRHIMKEYPELLPEEDYYCIDLYTNVSDETIYPDWTVHPMFIEDTIKEYLDIDPETLTDIYSDHGVHLARIRVELNDNDRVFVRSMEITDEGEKIMVE